MKQELSDILSKLIAIYPVTSNQASVKELLLFTNTHLQAAGIKNGTLIENQGFHMLTASTQNKKRAKVLLQAHVDVVPARKELQKATISKNGRMIGRGARDMLFAAAGYIWLMNELKQQSSKLDIGIMLTGDEEIGGESTVPFLLEKGYGADVVWLPDAGNSLQELVVRAKGVLNFTFSVHGQPHHGSRPWEGDNAALKLVSALHELSKHFEKNLREESSCSITKLEAGDSVNKGPGIAHARIDIRYDTKESRTAIENLIERLCKKYSGETSSVTSADNYTNNPSSPFIRNYVDINREITGKDVYLISTSGSSDARYFSAKDIPVIMTRPTSGGSHGDDEWVDLDSFIEYCEVMKEYVLKTARI